MHHHALPVDVMVEEEEENMSWPMFWPKMNFSRFGHVINPTKITVQFQSISHASQGPLMKWNLAAWQKGGLSHLPTCGYYWVLSDEISLLSHTSQVDEM
jgi:hypothetical protein